jgi:hypothetical protein
LKISTTRFTCHGLPSSQFTDQGPQVALEPRSSLPLGQRSRVGTRDDDVVVVLSGRLQCRPKRLPQEPFDPVSHDGPSNASTDRYSKSKLGTLPILLRLAFKRRAGKCVKNEVSARSRLAVAIDTVELCTAGQPTSLLPHGHALRL